MKNIEFENEKGELVVWGLTFPSHSAAKKGLKYVKKMFSKKAKIVDA